jgi:hypothetical protein
MKDKYFKLLEFVMNHSPFFDEHDIICYCYLTMCFMCYYSGKSFDITDLNLLELGEKKSAKGIATLMEKFEE